MRLALNDTYLVKFGVNGVLNSITVLLITEQAYHIQWNLGLRSKSSWESINDFHREYITVENITEFVVEKAPIKTYKINASTLMNCHYCNGNGRVPDNSNTSGYKICPVCFSNKNSI